MNTPWFRRWFGDTYKKLYPHRDAREAESQVRYVLRMLPVTPEWRVLDVGCGSGRHLAVLRAKGFVHCAGLDLSMPLLRDARAAGVCVSRGDMRRLPHRAKSFDLVTSFFTSFGYFATFEEDVEALSQFVSVLKPGGFLFLDLPNKEHLIKSLVPQDQRALDGAQVIQRRRLEQEMTGPCTVVIKEIEIQKPGAVPERYEERVRLYELKDMLALGRDFSLRHIASFGDERGASYRSDCSPRMSLLFQNAASAAKPPEPRAPAA